MATVSQTIPVAKTTPRMRETVPGANLSVATSPLMRIAGLVMLLMMAEVLQLSRWPRRTRPAFSGKSWRLIRLMWRWFGCSLHDTIQPGFSFLVGVALPYSIASRIAKGARFKELFWHALWRSLVLVALGVFSSLDGPFHDVLHV